MGKSPFIVEITILNGKINYKLTIEIVDLPIDSMVIFHSYVNVYQRVK